MHVWNTFFQTVFPCFAIKCLFPMINNKINIKQNNYEIRYKKKIAGRVYLVMERGITLE